MTIFEIAVIVALFLYMYSMLVAIKRTKNEYSSTKERKTSKQKRKGKTKKKRKKKDEYKEPNEFLETIKNFFHF